MAGLLAVTAGFVCAVSEAAANELSELKQQVEELQEQNRTLQSLMEQQQEAAAKQQDELRQQRALTDRLVQQMASLEHRASIGPSAGQPTASATARTAKSSPRLLDPLNEAATSYLQSLAPVGEPPFISNLNFRVFPSISFVYEKTGSEDNSTFRFEENSFTVTAEAMERVDFLLEGNYFFSPGANSIGFTLQRLTVGYAFSDLVNLRFGRMHTPLGYWNEAFHHGGWVSTTIDRPEIYRFDFDSAGGYLPTHSVGMDLSGRASLGTVDMEYFAGVLNGRGRTASEVPIAQDKNDSKALSLLLKLSPHAVEGLTFGSLIYWDNIPPNPSVARRVDSINEVIIGAHAVYLHEPFTLLTEFFTVHHDDHTSNLNTHS